MKSLPIAAGPPGAITVTTGSSLPGGPQRLRRNRKTGTFAELSEHLQNPPPCRHKRDRWMSPGYESDPVKGVGLRDANIIGAQFVGFDLDGPAGIGEPVGQIEATLAALPDGAAFIATTTWSSSGKSAPGHRRWRLFLPLNREVTDPNTVGFGARSRTPLACASGLTRRRHRPRCFTSVAPMVMTGGTASKTAFHWTRTPSLRMRSSLLPRWNTPNPRKRSPFGSDSTGKRWTAWDLLSKITMATIAP